MSSEKQKKAEQNVLFNEIPNVRLLIFSSDFHDTAEKVCYNDENSLCKGGKCGGELDSALVSGTGTVSRRKAAAGAGRVRDGSGARAGDGFGGGGYAAAAERVPECVFVRCRV